MSLRYAAQKALEALEEYAAEITTTNRGQEAIIALRAGLNEPDWEGEYQACVNRHNETLDELRLLEQLVASNQDWSETEALRESLREHMAEVHRLRAAGRQALEAMDYTRWAVADYAQKWGIPRHDAAMNTLRAALEPVTDCHDKEGDKLAPPFPTLAVHVGYRYQSPVGGWEYGDHIPAGFDTQKWAHQKIYILQEQA